MVVNLNYFSIRIMKAVPPFVKTLLNEEKFQAGISGRLLPMTKTTNIENFHENFIITHFVVYSFYHSDEHQVNFRKSITAVYREKTPKDFPCSIKWTLSFLLLHY